MTELIWILAFFIPICVLIAIFLVEAERMMREDAQMHPAKAEPWETGGLTRRELAAATARAMRTDAKLARMRAWNRRGKREDIG